VLNAWMRRFEGAPGEAAAFLDALCDAAAGDPEGYNLDYVRLNIEAQLPAATR